MNDLASYNGSICYSWSPRWVRRISSGRLRTRYSLHWTHTLPDALRSRRPHQQFPQHTTVYELEILGEKRLDRLRLQQPCFSIQLTSYFVVWYILFAVILTLSILVAVFDKQIVNWLTPAGRWMKRYVLPSLLVLQPHPLILNVQYKIWMAYPDRSSLRHLVSSSVFHGIL